jgi:DNA polymerase elongation subunit (family B)/predicted RNA-binding Zn-ribbon protein involved in translation (DUF1610 family)
MDNPSGMKVLTLDIETSPIQGYVWGLWQQNLQIDRIISPTRTLCWAAKWEHEDAVYLGSESFQSHEDMILEIYDLVNEADAIVGYNSQSFDMKHLNREFIELGLAPPLKYKNIDLLRVVKTMFKFPSNKLDYVAGVLLDEHKMDTGGFSLWERCLAGDKEAWKQMEEYNIEDVLLTERLYHHLQGWVPAHPNRALWIEDQSDPVCPNCGSTHVVRKGIERPARVNAYQRYKCVECGANSRGRSIVKKAGEGVLM